MTVQGPYRWKVELACEASDVETGRPNGVILKKGMILNESELDVQAKMGPDDIALKYKEEDIMVPEWCLEEMKPLTMGEEEW